MNKQFAREMLETLKWLESGGPEVEKHFANCDNNSDAAIEIKCKMSVSESGVDIEFLSKEDEAKFFYLHKNGFTVKLVQA
jgi:hypothetical protein